MLPLFSLAAGGVCRAVACCHRRGALLPHRFTLARTRLATSRWRTVLCCTVRGLSPPRCYLAPCSMQPGLSSMQCPCGPTPRPFNQRPTTGTRSVAVVGCWLLVEEHRAQARSYNFAANPRKNCGSALARDAFQPTPTPTTNTSTCYLILARIPSSSSRLL